MLRFVRRDPRPFDDAAQRALRPCAGPLAALLYARGVETAAQAEAFLHPGLDALHDPFLLGDMAEAVALLAQAKAGGWPVVVYGDYDADGVCAAALATEALRCYGVNATPHVPLRAEGYGLNIEAVTRLAGEYRLMVTVDLGMTNADEILRAQSLGMRVIVTDHHQPGLTPCPADAVVNPLLNGYPFPRLCGAGVAYKLAAALLGAREAEQWLDLAALATVADIVPLLNENRALVACGLPRIGERPGLAALIAAAGCRQPLNAETVAYQLAPRINAAGRIADAALGVRLLLTRDPAEAEALARKLDAANAERKRLEADAVREAEEQTAAHDFVRRRVLFVRGQGWHTGVVGLVAGRLNHRLSVPVCALSEEDGLLHGSLRGVPGVNLARCLQTCDDLLLRYGGHELAAGVTLEVSKAGAFCDRLEDAVRVSAAPEVFVPAQAYDLPLAFADADDALLDALALMEPFGCGNPAPVFLTGNARLLRRRACGAQGAHLQLTLRDGDRMLDGVAFSMGALANRLPDGVDVAYTLARETFRGNTAIQCRVEAITPAAPSLLEALAAEPDDAFDRALLRALTEELEPFPMQTAGNGAVGAESNKAAIVSDTAVSEAFSGSVLTADAEPAAAGAVLETDGSLERPAGIPPMEELLQGRQGTLFVAWTRRTAVEFLKAYGDCVDLAYGSPDDPRCFHTLLAQPDPGALRGGWRAVVLLDGVLTPRTADRFRGQFPAAAVYAAAPTPALRERAAAIDAGDEAYRSLYRHLRRNAFGSLREAAEAAALTEAQTGAGLSAFRSLELLSFSEVPFRYAFRETRKCSLNDSPTLSALRALAAREEAREC